MRRHGGLCALRDGAPCPRFVFGNPRLRAVQLLGYIDLAEALLFPEFAQQGQQYFLLASVGA
jgi:hypothetical protein